MNNLEIFSPLSAEELADLPLLEGEDAQELVPIVPVPADAPALDFRHPTLGSPITTWPYHNESGGLVGYVARFEKEHADGVTRQFYPLTFCESATGSRSWRAKGFPKPYPLFHLPLLLQKPDAPILVCNGERAAEAAQALFPDHVCITNAFGPNGVSNTDWTPLRTRKVILCPETGEEEAGFVEARAEQLYRAGAAEVRVLNFSKVHHSRHVRHFVEPGDEDNWGFYVALQRGCTPESLATAIEDMGELDLVQIPLAWDPYGNVSFRLGHVGVEARLPLKTKEDPDNPRWGFLCSKIVLVAEIRDENGAEWRKTFRVTTKDGQENDVIVPYSALAGDGTQLRETFLRAGAVLGSSRQQKELFFEYVTHTSTTARLVSVDQVGWHGDCFVTANWTQGGSSNNEEFVFLGTQHSVVGARRGSLEAWQQSVGQYASGNPILMFALCAAFVPPLLAHVGGENGGFHLIGNSSTGKTTALAAAGSVWGGGPRGYHRAWRLTSNGLEGIANAHCDSLLCLDELSQLKSSDAGSSAYMLANGSGKTRANLKGEARPAVYFRLLFLSSGELTLADKVAEDGRHAQVTAGQQVRVVDLRVDTLGKTGIVSDMHGFNSSQEFVNAVKSAASENYGWPIYRFLERLTANMDASAVDVELMSQAFMKDCLPTGDVDGQVRRVAQRFALVAAAGELAIKFGVLPWKSGDAVNAVRLCFYSWLGQRGSVGSMEIDAVITRIRGYLQSNGQSRFERSGGEGEREEEGENRIYHELDGFVRSTGPGANLYCFFPSSFAKACSGINEQTARRLLNDEGYLVTDKNDSTYSVRYNGKKVRVVAVKESIMYEPEPLGLFPEQDRQERQKTADFLEKLRSTRFT